MNFTANGLYLFEPIRVTLADELLLCPFYINFQKIDVANSFLQYKFLHCDGRYRLANRVCEIDMEAVFPITGIIDDSTFVPNSGMNHL